VVRAVDEASRGSAAVGVRLGVGGVPRFPVFTRDSRSREGFRKAIGRNVA